MQCRVANRIQVAGGDCPRLTAGVGGYTIVVNQVTSIKIL